MSHIKSIQIHEKHYDEFHPAVIASSGAKNMTELSEDVTLAVRSGVDLFEWRADKFYELSPDVLVRTVACLKKGLSGIPLLFTCRSDGLYPVETCVAFYESVSAGRLVDAVDIELALCDKIAPSAFAANGIFVIISEHFFDDTEYGLLAETVGRMDPFGCDLIKIAVSSKKEDWPSRADRLNALTDRPLCLIVMGDAGQIYRRRPCLLHSVITYGHLSKPTAPGQVSVGDLMILRKEESV